MNVWSRESQNYQDLFPEAAGMWAGGKQNDLFQHHAGRKPYTIKTASLLIANLREL